MADDQLSEFFDVFEKMREDYSQDEISAMLQQVQTGKNKSYWQGNKRSEKRKDFLEFFENHLPNTKRDLFSNAIYTKDIDKFSGWVPLLNYKKNLEGICADYGLNPNYTERFLSIWTTDKQPELLIEMPEWDGTDHIKNALDRITVKNIEHSYFVDLMKDWFSKIIRRTYQPKIQNRLPIFRGRQGMGKDYSIRAMTSGFGRYVNEIDFQQNNKTEVYRIIKSLAVGIIPEFDETNSSSLSVLKSVITAESIELRALYKNESESIPIRTSFISASNFEDVLRDSSGNRRFMVFDIDDIEHSFHEVDGDQILAQAFDLAQEEFSPSIEAEMSMAEILKNETPESSDQLFLQEMMQYIERVNANSLGKIRWPDIAEEVSIKSRKYRFSVKRAQQILRRNGLAHRDSKSIYYDVSPEM